MFVYVPPISMCHGVDTHSLFPLCVSWSRPYTPPSIWLCIRQESQKVSEFFWVGKKNTSWILKSGRGIRDIFFVLVGPCEAPSGPFVSSCLWISLGEGGHRVNTIYFYALPIDGMDWCSRFLDANTQVHYLENNSYDAETLCSKRPSNFRTSPTWAN